MSGLPTIAAIQQAVAEHYGVPLAKMREPEPTSKSQANVWTYSRPRQVAMCLAIRLTGHHYTVVGRHFGGRHSTTVLHACRVVEKRRETDAKLHNAMRRITLDLVRH